MIHRSWFIVHGYRSWFTVHDSPLVVPPRTPRGWKTKGPILTDRPMLFVCFVSVYTRPVVVHQNVFGGIVAFSAFFWPASFSFTSFILVMSSFFFVFFFITDGLTRKTWRLLFSEGFQLSLVPTNNSGFSGSVKSIYPSIYKIYHAKIPQSDDGVLQKGL